MELRRYEHREFTSNVFLLRSAQEKALLVVDMGVEAALADDWLDSSPKPIALLLTHAHYDHIYALNQWVDKFPDTPIYGHPECLSALSDPKLNLSFYHEDPIIFKGGNLKPLRGDKGVLRLGGLEIAWFASPGHHSGHVVYEVARHLFSGDACIPGHPVVTKLKGGNKEAAQKSLQLIKERLAHNDFLAPGHGPLVPTTEALSQLPLSHI